ncbi:hypothetical protein ACP4OV_003861 [Aristida adscensionis]
MPSTVATEPLRAAAALAPQPRRDVVAVRGGARDSAAPGCRCPRPSNMLGRRRGRAPGRLAPQASATPVESQPLVLAGVLASGLVPFVDIHDESARPESGLWEPREARFNEPI